MWLLHLEDAPQDVRLHVMFVGNRLSGKISTGNVLLSSQNISISPEFPQLVPGEKPIVLWFLCIRN